MARTSIRDASAQAPPRPAFYARGHGRLGDVLTLLHPPYTLWHLSYFAIGAALAPTVHLDRLLWGLAAFALAVGVAAHALDECTTIRTSVSDRAGRAQQCGDDRGARNRIAGAVVVRWLAPLVAFGVLFLPAYNLELAGGRFHSDLWFAFGWGAFPAFTGFFANSLKIEAAGVLIAAGCMAISLAQRRLSTPARELRRRTLSVDGERMRSDGSSEPLTVSSLLAPLDGALIALRWRSLTAAALSCAAVARGAQWAASWGSVPVRGARADRARRRGFPREAGARSRRRRPPILAPPRAGRSRSAARSSAGSTQSRGARVSSSSRRPTAGRSPLSGPTAACTAHSRKARASRAALGGPGRSLRAERSISRSSARPRARAALGAAALSRAVALAAVEHDQPPAVERQREIRLQRAVDQHGVPRRRTGTRSGRAACLGPLAVLHARASWASWMRSQAARRDGQSSSGTAPPGAAEEDRPPGGAAANLDAGRCEREIRPRAAPPRCRERRARHNRQLLAEHELVVLSGEVRRHLSVRARPGELRRARRSPRRSRTGARVAVVVGVLPIRLTRPGRMCAHAQLPRATAPRPDLAARRR